MRKNKSIYTIFLINILIVSIVGATFSYFIAKNDKNVILKTKNSQNISFIIDTPIYLTKRIEEKDKNVLANTNSLVYDISIELDIEKEEKVYLQIFNPQKEEIRVLNGLSYIDNEEVKGFEITDFKGNLDIVQDYLYEENQNWRFILTYADHPKKFTTPKVIIK